MAWQAPKTDWTRVDSVREDDFNRIEDNILYLYDRAGLTSDRTIYVKITGDDLTGNGTSAAPYRTISFALGTIPRNLNGKTVMIDIGNGTYEENVTVSGYNDGLVVLYGTYGREIYINRLEVSNSVLEIRGVRVNVGVGGVTVTNGSTFLGGTNISIIGAARGVYVAQGSNCRLSSQLRVDDATTAAIYVAGASRLYVLSIVGANNTAIIIAEEGSVASYGSTSITVNAVNFISRTGGRITTGSGGV